MADLVITEYTDPGCPWAYYAEPFRRRLEWLYGDSIRWRRQMVVLAEDPQESYEIRRDRDGARGAAGTRSSAATRSPAMRPAGRQRGSSSVSSTGYHPCYHGLLMSEQTCWPTPKTAPTTAEPDAYDADAWEVLETVVLAVERDVVRSCGRGDPRGLKAQTATHHDASLIT